MYFAPNAIHTPLQATKADYDALPQIKDHRLRVYGAMVRNLDRNVGRILQDAEGRGARQEHPGDLHQRQRRRRLHRPAGDQPALPRLEVDLLRGRHPRALLHALAGPDPAGLALRLSGRPRRHLRHRRRRGRRAGSQGPGDRRRRPDALPRRARRAGRPHQTLFWRSGQYKVVLDGDWKLQSSEAQHKVWLYDLATDPTEHHELSQAQPARAKAMLALLAAQDRQSVKPMWPSLLQGPVFVDHPERRAAEGRARNTSCGTTDAEGPAMSFLPPSTNDQYRGRPLGALVPGAGRRPDPGPRPDPQLRAERRRRGDRRPRPGRPAQPGDRRLRLGGRDPAGLGPRPCWPWPCATGR